MAALRQTKKMFKDLERIVRKLVQYSANEWKLELNDSTTRKRLKSGVKSRYKRLIVVRPPLDSEGFNEEIEKATDYEMKPERLLYLPPLVNESGFIPVLGLRCWFLNNPPKIKLRLGFFGGLDKDGNIENGLGFRFETRHNGDKHNFDHMQLCVGPFDNPEFNKEYLRSPSWLPMSWPAVVIPSTNPISLLLSMLVSLYGKEILLQFTHINLKEYIKALVYVLETR